MDRIYSLDLKVTPTGFNPSVLVESIAGVLLRRARIRAAESLALFGSEAREVARAREKAGNTIAPYTLKR